jgi:hypothetical protein
MTRKVLMVISLLVATVICFANVTNRSLGTSIFLQTIYEVGYIDPAQMGGQKPKAPMRAPEVYQEDHTLTFSYNNGFTLELVDASMGDGDSVVYSADIPEGVLTWQLPATLSGNYTIRLRYGNWTFVGEIEL